MPSAVVKLSELGPVKRQDFEETVKAFANEVSHHAAHMKAVKDGDAQAYPAPDAAELIKRCIRTKANGEIVVDFVIEDDSPTPPTETEKAATALRNRKVQLLNQVSAEENRLVAEVFPEAKKRMINYRRTDVLKADNERRMKAHVERQKEIETKSAEVSRLAAEIQSKGFIAQIKDALAGPPKLPPSLVEAMASVPPPLLPDDLDRAAADGRSTDDAEFMTQFDKIHARVDALARHGAKLHAQIHDLTLETIDAWKPEPFPS